MRLPSLVVAALCLTAGSCLAQSVSPLSVTRVSFNLREEATVPGGFPTDGKREPRFEMGTPEGSGFRDQPAAVTRPRGTVRLSEQRTRKAFGVPWQTGIFQ